MKNRRLEIRLSEEELEEIDRRAKLLKLTRSKCLLQSVMHQRIILLDNTSIKQLTNELRKIGINVNQIALLANMGKLECVHIEDTNAQIKKVWQELRKLREDVKKLNEEN